MVARQMRYMLDTQTHAKPRITRAYGWSTTKATQMITIKIWPSVGKLASYVLLLWTCCWLEAAGVESGDGYLEENLFFFRPKHQLYFLWNRGGLIGLIISGVDNLRMRAATKTRSAPHNWPDYNPAILMCMVNLYGCTGILWALGVYRVINVDM